MPTGSNLETVFLSTIYGDSSQSRSITSSTHNSLKQLKPVSKLSHLIDTVYELYLVADILTTIYDY